MLGRNLVGLELYGQWDGEAWPVSYGAYVRGATRVALVSVESSNVTGADVLKMSCYDVHFRVPKTLREGRYEVYIHNGHGGRWGWSAPLRLEVKQREQWPQRVFNVREYGAVGDGKADDAPAIQAALRDARKNRGGIVYIPHGSYLINSTLTVSRKVIVRGESRERTWIWLPTGVHYGTREAGMKVEVAVQGDGEFVLEDLTMHGVYVRNMVQAPVDFRNPDSPAARNVTIWRCRLMVEPTLRRHYRRGDPFLTRERLDGDTSWQYRYCVAVRGDYHVVQDSSLRGGGTCIFLQNTRYCTIQRNELLIGSGNAFIIFPGKGLPENVIIEDNDSRPLSNMTSNWLWSHRRSKRFYMARNRIELSWCRDSECILWHSLQYRFVARVAEASSTTVRFDPKEISAWRKRQRGRVRFYDDAAGAVRPGALKGFECLVVDGRGLGQLRTVVDNTADSVTLDRPWALPPAHGSLVALTENPQFEGHIVLDNVLEHTGPGIDIWGNGYDVVVDGNVLRRSGGPSMWDVGSKGTYREWAGHFFVQLLHNTVAEGRYHSDVDTRYAQHIFQGVTGLAPARSVGHAGLGMVIRGNRAQTDSSICVVPHGAKHAGLIIEDNYCVSSHRGIWVGRGASGALRGNRFKDVDEPLRDDDSDLWIHPAERLAARLQGARTLLRSPMHKTRLNWDEVDSGLGRLTRRSADDPSVREECEKLFDRVWAELARVVPDRDAPRILRALVGLRVSASRRSPLYSALAQARAGKTELLLDVSVPRWAPDLGFHARPRWPTTWKAAAAPTSLRLRPGQSTTVSLPVVLPERVWGAYAVELVFTVAVGDTPLEARTTLNVGRGEVREWMLVGPFPNKSKAAVDTTLHPPEERIDLGGVYRGIAGEVRWRPIRTGREIRLERLLKPGQPATAYALACLKAGADLSATLRVSCRGGVEVWVNDERLSSVCGRSGTRTTAVQLVRGLNVLFCKVSGGPGPWRLAVEVNEFGQGGRVRVLSAETLREIPALNPPPVSNATQAQLKHTRGVTWRVVWTDDFERRALGPKWRAARGSWKIVRGVLHGEGPAFLAYRGKLAAPVRIEYDARSPRPTDLSAFWLRSPADYNSGYLFAFASGNTWNRISINGRTAESSNAPLAKPGRWHHVIAQILPRGRTQLIVDDKLAVQHVSARLPDGMRYVGLWTWELGEFDNVRVYISSDRSK